MEYDELHKMYEKHVVVKLFHQQELQKTYLPDILISLFADRTRKLIMYSMKFLYEKNLPITMDNIMLIQSDKMVIKFKKKYNIKDLTLEMLDEEVNDVLVDKTKALFEQSFRMIHDNTFFRITDSIYQDMAFDIKHNMREDVLNKAKAILKINEMIYDSKLKNRKDGIKAMQNLVNNETAYIPFSSNKLTSILGGWSRGWAGTMVGKPSHGKSTFMSYEAKWLIDKNILQEVHIASPEEPEEAFWRRIFAMEFKIPLQYMMRGLVKITDEQVGKIKEKYGGRIFFHKVTTASDFINLLFSEKPEFIYIDHVNALQYPKGDMYKGIIYLLTREKEYLVENKQSVIVNLSQVNTKVLKNARRLKPEKEDAYMSSVLEQASREFLVVYYPYKDMMNNPQDFVGKGVTPNQIFISIEKNSFGDIGEIEMFYKPEYCIFEDAPDFKNISNVILPENKIETLFGEEK